MAAIGSVVWLALIKTSLQEATVKLGRLGSLYGFDSGNVRTYYSVPYATPPLGDLRFRPAQPPHPWGFLRADVPGPSCLQGNVTGDVKAVLPGPTSEDCLYLNVHTPVPGIANGKALPVLVWVHGGGFIQGSGNEYNGTALVERSIQQGKPLLVVTINYRLGMLGFYADETLAKETGGQGTGSLNGVLDQIAALRFLQNHVAAFGGDPKAITMFGQSAGGISACILAISPLSKGLLVRDIVQSGPCVGPWGPNIDKQTGLDVGSAFRESVGCTSLEELRKLPAQTVMGFHGTEAAPLLPAVDGYVLPTRPFEMLADVHVDELLIGTTSLDSTAAWVPWVTPQTDTELESVFRKANVNSSIREQVMRFYDAEPSASPSLTFFRLEAHTCVQCATRILARHFDRRTKTSVYMFSGSGELSDPLPYLVPHRGELAELFGQGGVFHGFPPQRMPFTKQLSDILMDDWIAFANGAWLHSRFGVDGAFVDYRNVHANQNESFLDRACDMWEQVGDFDSSAWRGVCFGGVEHTDMPFYI